MAFRGQVKNGIVVCDDPLPLADGTSVTIEPVNQPEADALLGQRLMKFAGLIEGKDSPKDGSINHDHYLYGGQPAAYQSIWASLLELAGTVEGLPADASENIDHYLYGTPKRDSK